MDRITESFLQEFSSLNEISGKDQSKQFEYFANHCVINKEHGSGSFELNETLTGVGTQGIDGIAIIANNKIIELRRTAEMKKLTLTFSADNDPVLEKIPCDAERISDVFQNLVSNAISYTPENGTVAVSLRRFGNDVRVSVSDTGIGISKDYQKNIFVKFYRAPNGARVDPNGTGLGLFIAKTIIEKHAGKCWFESAENKGATFYFTLPIK